MGFFDNPNIQGFIAGSIAPPTGNTALIKHHLEDAGGELSFTLLQGRTRLKNAQLYATLYLMRNKGQVERVERSGVEYWRLIG